MLSLEWHEWPKTEINGLTSGRNNNEIDTLINYDSFFIWEKYEPLNKESAHACVDLMFVTGNIFNAEVRSKHSKRFKSWKRSYGLHSNYNSIFKFGFRSLIFPLPFT